ncbi:hypothetical protein HU200_025568 [Digitaria exilis]|uniref:Uncharacterized protein n=1 Tax=Digitaria exilis TaxID=1010633 RepID=A0A835C0C2_9POAL|nr:hypothetical protein HU200_025568 [Digitaria exilis]
MTKRLQKSVAVLALVLCAAATVAESNTFTFPVYSAARAFHHRRSVSGGKVTAAQPTAGPSTTPAPGGVVVAPVSSPAPAMPVAPAPAPMEPVLSPVTTPAPAPSMLAPAPAGPTPPTPGTCATTPSRCYTFFFAVHRGNSLRLIGLVGARGLI